jgi:hypothetical protein
MFIHMDKDKEDLIKQTGRLTLNINPFVDDYREQDKMEYVITYCNKQLDCYPMSIFRCVVTKSHDCLLIEDLKLRIKDAPHLSEESLHLFVGWTITDAPKWAKMFGKNSIILQTRLPHCTEWFVECGYDLYPLKGAHTKDYRGIKKVWGSTNNEKSKN